VIAFFLWAALAAVIGVGVWAFARLSQPALRVGISASTAVAVAALATLIARA